VAGREEIHGYLKAQIAPVQGASTVLDLGGGTGSARHLWPASCNYICLDNDALKLRGLAAKHSDSWGLLADGMKIPVKSGSLDVVMCVGVSHHLPEGVFAGAVSETMRILKPSGRFIFLDATWNPEHSVGRFMWKYDRGSTPHTAAKLHAILSDAGNVLSWQTFAIYHRYVLGVIVPRIS
jgi:SAM-dependent methyltransferase